MDKEKVLEKIEKLQKRAEVDPITPAEAKNIIKEVFDLVGWVNQLQIRREKLEKILDTLFQNESAHGQRQDTLMMWAEGIERSRRGRGQTKE